MLIIAVVAGVCIKITRTKLDKVVTYTYFAAYDTLNSVSANLIGNSYSIKKQDTEHKEGTCSTEKQCPDGYAFDKSVCDCVSISVTLPTNGNDFCEAVEESVNTISSNCSGNNKSAISQAVASKDFSGVQPDIVLRNGMKLYNVKNDYVEIPQLKGNMKTANNVFSGVTLAIKRNFYLVYINIKKSILYICNQNLFIPKVFAYDRPIQVDDDICPSGYTLKWTGNSYVCMPGCAAGYQLIGGKCVKVEQAHPMCLEGQVWSEEEGRCVTIQMQLCDLSLISSCLSSGGIMGPYPECKCIKQTCDSNATQICQNSGGWLTPYPGCKCNCPAGYASSDGKCVELTCATDVANACYASHGTMSSYLEGCTCKCEEPYESTGANTCRRKTCNADAISQCRGSGGEMTDYPDCGCYCPAGMFEASGTCVTMDEAGYIVYVDVNGNSGDSILYEDVFPFYLTLSGTVVPGFPEDGSERGGNSKSDLEVSLQYDDYSGQARVVKWLLKSTSFREAACKSGYIQTSAYCGGMTIDDKCKVQDADCRLVPIRPIKM